MRGPLLVCSITGVLGYSAMPYRQFAIGKTEESYRIPSLARISKAHRDRAVIEK